MKQLIVITGATASGKTAHAIQLAHKFNTEIISADSRQVFKELTIGTAKPTPDQLNEIPHHFINNISITQTYNAGIFETEAIEVITQLFIKHDILIMAGGSGLYINAVLHGFDPLPEADLNLRRQLNADYEKHGIEYLQQQLLHKDPVYYNQVDIQNPQRIMRALEVCILSGKPFSALRSSASKPSKRNFSVQLISMDVERQELYDRINSRVDTMMNNGLLDEVKGLVPYKTHNALQTVGYKELFDYLDGKISLTEAVELIKKNTRNYAKRQLTWFKRVKVEE